MECFRLVLRCRQEARTRFAKMRSDVLVKMELLDQKHGKDHVSPGLSMWAQESLNVQCYSAVSRLARTFFFFFSSLEKIIRSFCFWKSRACAVSMELTKLLKLNDLCGHCCFRGDALNS